MMGLASWSIICFLQSVPNKKLVAFSGHNINMSLDPFDLHLSVAYQPKKKGEGRPQSEDIVYLTLHVILKDKQTATFASAPPPFQLAQT